jgi:hypothetical protein
MEVSRQPQTPASLTLTHEKKHVVIFLDLNETRTSTSLLRQFLRILGLPYSNPVRSVTSQLEKRWARSSCINLSMALSVFPAPKPPVHWPCHLALHKPLRKTLFILFDMERSVYPIHGHAYTHTSVHFIKGGVRIGQSV